MGLVAVAVCWFLTKDPQSVSCAPVRKRHARPTLKEGPTSQDSMSIPDQLKNAVHPSNAKNNKYYDKAQREAKALKKAQKEAKKQEKLEEKARKKAEAKNKKDSSRS